MLLPSTPQPSYPTLQIINQKGNYLSYFEMPEGEGERERGRERGRMAEYRLSESEQGETDGSYIPRSS